MRLSKNVYLLSGDLYGSHQNVYAIDCGKSVIVIDTGKDRYDWDQINRNLRYWDIDHKPIAFVLLTHAHYEHAGNAARFEVFGSSILCHPLCAEAVGTGNDRTASHVFPDLPKFEVCHRAKAVEDRKEIQCGGVVITPIFTPGHSDDSVCYLVSAGGVDILFTGDTVLNGDLCQTSRLGYTGGIDYSQEKYLETLEMLSVFEVDWVLPGHGEICLTRGDRVLVGAWQRARLDLATQPSMSFSSDDFFR